MAALEASPIPIELCPTSNMKTLRLSSLADHPTLRRWIEGGYPVSISTDDFGVFSTTASQRAQTQTSHRVPGRAATIGSRLPPPARGGPPGLQHRAWAAWATQCSPGASSRRSPTTLASPPLTFQASAELALVADALALPPRRIAELAAAALGHGLDADAAFGRRFRADVEAALAECALVPE